jgi:5'-nucleotidase
MRFDRLGGLLTTVAALACAAAACSSSGSHATTATTTTVASTTTTVVPANLTVLVTNDDGYSAPGIDTMLQALLKLPGTSVTVVAPLKNQSGTGGRTTRGALTATRVRTASGFAATAVDGYPADTIRYALSTVLATPPDLVVSGISNGQNVGPFIAVSGTVGAAEAAATRGIPAIAASQGFGNPPDFASAARIVVSWITQHRSEYVGARHGKADVININVPTCTTGSVRAVKQVPAARDLAHRDITKVDCTSTAGAPRDDVDAFVEGFAAVTELDSAGSTVTATTDWTG